MRPHLRRVGNPDGFVGGRMAAARLRRIFAEDTDILVSSSQFTITDWTSSTARGIGVVRVIEGNVPPLPAVEDHVMLHVTDTDAGHATGRPSTPVRCK
jgi:hypothetical protein